MTYRFKCNICGREACYRRSIEARNEEQRCGSCWSGAMCRKFEPTANISIPAAFGVFQRDFAPPRAARECLGNDSQSHAPAAESLEQFLERDLRA